MTLFHYWVREVPAGAVKGDFQEQHYKLLGGEKGCNEIPEAMQMHFPTWEMAQSMANALEATPPTEEQESAHQRGDL